MASSSGTAASAAPPPNTTAPPMNTTTIGVYIEFFVGFREETTDTEHSRYAWLSQRLAAPDICPPVIRMPVRRVNNQYDPYLADVLVVEAGPTPAERGYKVKPNPNLEDARQSDPSSAPLRHLVQCATNTSFYITNRTVYIQKDIAELWDSKKWVIMHGVQAQLHLGHDNDNASDALNTYSWRPMKATSPMLELDDIFAPGVDANAASQLWLRDFVARLRRNTLMQINPSCRPYMQVQFGDYNNDDDSTQTLISLKRLATMAFLGAEDCLRRAFITPQRKAQLCMLTESSMLRVHPYHKYIKPICEQTSVVNENAGNPGLNPTRVRTYRNDIRDLGNIKFYNEHAAHFNGPAPPRSQLIKRMQARARAEEALQAVDGGFSATEPRRVNLADPARIAEYARHGLDMERVLADDIYLIWRCKTPDILGRILSPHFFEDEHLDEGCRKQFKSVFDFTAFRGDEVRNARLPATHSPLPVRFNIFPPTLDADLLQAQTRVVCGLAHHAANDSPDAVEHGRQAAASQLQTVQPAQPQPLQPLPLPALPPVVQAPAPAPAQIAQIPNDGTIDPSLLMIGAASSSSLLTGDASNHDGNNDDDATVLTSADDDLMNSILSGDVSLNDGNDNDSEADDVLADILGDYIPPLPATLAAPPLDSWLTTEPATHFLGWLGLTDSDITRLDAFTNGGKHNPADDVALDGVMRNYTR